MKAKYSLLFVTLAIVLGACSGGDMSQDGISSKDKQASSRLDEIAKSSGGDWEKVSEADRTFLVQEIAQGSEPSAKKLLEGKAGKLRAAPGGGASGGSKP